MNLNKIVRKTCFTLVIAALLLAVLVPFGFFITTSFTSAYDMYEFPKTLIPRFSYDLKFAYNEDGDGNYRLYIQGAEGYEAVYSGNDSYSYRKYLRNQLNVALTDSEMEEIFAQARENGVYETRLHKDMFQNFQQFFVLTDGAMAALLHSIEAAFWTILISLTIGSMSGYALARCRFPFKEGYSISLLFVRIFPTIAISLPMLVIVMKSGLYDTMLALGIVYAIPNIALTAWITNSIFSGIGVELEEASLVFGANRLTTFKNITLPLALPGLVASSLYAFLAAWNDSFTALILTSQNQTCRC